MDYIYDKCGCPDYSDEDLCNTGVYHKKIPEWFLPPGRERIKDPCFFVVAMTNNTLLCIKRVVSVEIRPDLSMWINALLGSRKIAQNISNYNDIVDKSIGSIYPLIGSDMDDTEIMINAAHIVYTRTVFWHGDAAKD